MRKMYNYFCLKESQVDLVEKIKNENKNRTRASLFLSSEDGKQEFFLCGLKKTIYKGVYNFESSVLLNLITPSVDLKNALI